MRRDRLPLLLTASRFALGPLYWLAMPGAAPSMPGPAPSAMALGIALAAAATDFADGRLARRLGGATAAGAALDVAADAAFVLPALCALARAGIVSVLLPAAAAAALAALALRWSSPGRRGAGARRGLADRAGHAAGILNYGATIVGAAVVAGAPGGSALAPASLALALLNLAPIALRAAVPSR